MKTIGQTVDGWIREDELAVSAVLRPIRSFDELRIDDVDEAEAYWDFIGWYLGLDYAPLAWVPVQDMSGWFPGFEIDEAGNDVSHFNTWDYVKQSGYRFDVEHWLHKKVLLKVRDLGITYSVLSDVQAKDRVKARFVCLVDSEYRDQALAVLDAYKRYGGLVDKDKARERISMLNRKIRDCGRVWLEATRDD